MPHKTREDKNAAARRWYARNKERLTGPINGRERHLKREYGMSLVEYQGLVEQQQGLCAICYNPPDEGKLLQVDHDHKTTEVRSLLCELCNRGLGCFGESIEVLKKAVEYLEDWKNV